MARKRTRASQKKILGNHQRCWLWGRNLVRETLAAGCWPILELHLADRLDKAEIADARAELTRWNVDMIVEPTRRLTELAHVREHQGYLAKMGPYPYANPDQVLAASRSDPLFLMLDSVQDPYNFGAMIRSAEVFAADGIFIQDQRQVGVTSLVARSSVGAVNRIPIAQVTSLVAQTEKLRQAGIAVYGASEKADAELGDCDLTGPVAIVIGNEGVGIAPELRAACDQLVRIPLSGRIGSLNAAVAAGIFLYEARRKRIDQ